jgi:hypothetical protein
MAVNDLSKVFGIPSPTGTLDLTPQFQTSPATGTLGLEQPSTLKRAGSRISNNLARMGGYDPMQLSNAEERKRARLAGLQELSYRLSQTAAKLSGDPARMQIAQQQEAARQPKAVKPPVSYQEYALTDSTPTPQEYAEWMLEKETSKATKIDLGTDKGFAELGVKKYEERSDLATSARASNINLDNLENLLDQGVETGFGSEIGLTLNRIGQRLAGSDYKAGEIAGAESFLAGTNQLILPLVKLLGVNPTDKDLDFVVKGAPELGKSVEGNKLMLKALKVSNARAIDQHNFDNAFYVNPENSRKTEIDRNIAFQIHMAENPQIYSSAPLIEEYNNLLERQAVQKLNDGNFANTSKVELPDGWE